MAIDSNHVTKLGELKRLIDGLWDKINSTFSAIGHTHVKADITDFPSSMPASDVSDWAKASTKPSYTASEVGALPDTTVIPTVPTNVSAFNNDAGYITEETEPAYTSSPASGITSTDISKWNQAASTTELFWCTYGTTTYDDVMTALNAGNFPLVEINLGDESVQKPAIFVFCGVQTSRGGFFIQFRTTNSNGADSPSILHYHVTLTNSGWSDVCTDEFAEVTLVEGVKTCGVSITGNAATADNASGRKFTVQSEGEEAFIKASNGTQSVVLDVLGDGSKRGVWCNASGTGSSVWALQINQNNVVTLNGTATYANTAKKLDVSAKIGSSSNPVFIGANGVPSECGFSIVIGSTGTDTSTLYFV